MLYERFFLISQWIICYIVVYIIPFTSAELAYYVGTKNEDCPVNKIIISERECISAAAELGLTYRTLKNGTKTYQRPAGCYTDHYSLKNSTKDTFFNAVIDPSSTTPTDGTAGVCRSGTII
jgi:hypothetical protein